MPFTAATLDYFANPTGASTAGQLATAMAGEATSVISAARLKILGATLTSISGSVVAGRARLRIVLNISSATFQARFPSVEAGGKGPFSNILGGNLRMAINQPVVAAAPAYT